MTVCNGNILGAVITIQGESQSMQVILQILLKLLSRELLLIWCVVFVFTLLVCFQGEIGIFFPLIVLRPLDALEFPLNQKLSVLR